MRSTTSSNSRSCVATSTAPCQSASADISHCRAGPSRWLVGSSSSSTSASERNAPAKATRARSPPLSLFASCRGARCSSPTPASARCQRAGISQRPSASNKSASLPRPSPSRASAASTASMPASAATVTPAQCWFTTCTRPWRATVPAAGSSVPAARAKSTLLPTPLSPTRPAMPPERFSVSGSAHSTLPSGRSHCTWQNRSAQASEEEEEEEKSGAVAHAPRCGRVPALNVAMVKLQAIESAAFPDVVGRRNGRKGAYRRMGEEPR